MELDLEDHSMHNNLRIRGISESIAPDALCPFLIDLMASVLPSWSQFDLTIDHIHQILKPKNISPHTPRETIVWIFLLRERRNLQPYQNGFNNLPYSLTSQLPLCSAGKNLHPLPMSSEITASNTGGASWWSWLLEHHPWIQSVQNLQLRKNCCNNGNSFPLLLTPHLVKEPPSRKSSTPLWSDKQLKLRATAITCLFLLTWKFPLFETVLGYSAVDASVYILT